MANRRRYTAELLKGFRRGINRVVCSLQPYTDREVEYSPRSKHDAEPWVLVTGDAPYRFSGRECHLLNWRFQVEDRGTHFAVVDSVSGVVLDRIGSRYGAEDTALRYEADPVLALEQKSRLAEAIREGDMIIVPWNGGRTIDIVKDAYIEGGLVFITTSGQCETSYFRDDEFTVGVQRKADA